MTVVLPPFTLTAVDDISSAVARLRTTFISQKTRPVSFRLKQLRRLYWAIEGHEHEIIEACKKDLGKGYFEAMLSEINWIKNDLVFMTTNLEKWARDEKPEDISFPNTLMSPRVRKDPLGVVLVIGAFNFPINLSFGPMIGAIAGGNTVVLKPSERAPNCAAVMQMIMDEALDSDCYVCVQGALEQSKKLLEEKWDKIFFTGSVNTAKVVAKAAAATLTPVALELGGRNPAIITKKADMRLAARRLLWAKTMNAGQVCISQNYTLIDREVSAEFISQLKVAMKEFFPNGAQKNPDYSRIVDIAHYNRLKKMLDSTSGKIVIGGTMDASELFIEPTVVVVDDANDALITEESFGPFMPILQVDSLDEAISIANQVHETPLAVYAFGSKSEADQILKGTRSGGASVNDGLYHGIIPTLAFGGVGDSGTGSYRGKASFDCFVHRRSITTTPGWMEKLLAMRYPPFTGTNKYKQFARTGVLKPNFDREGNVKTNWLTYLLTLGTGSVWRGASRAAILAVVAMTIRLYIDNQAIAAPK